MTPIEAVVKAAHEHGLPSEALHSEDFVVWPFEATHARSIITAFLTAAANDDALCQAITDEVEAWRGEGARAAGGAAIRLLRRIAE